MQQCILFIILILSLSGCAINEVYNPLAAASAGTFELNHSALKQVKLGMTESQVHQIMGDEIIIGYNYPINDNGTPAAITLSNPLKTEKVNDAKGQCVLEYYATAVIVPDGIVSDEELIPIRFCGGVVTAIGWDKSK